MSFVKVIRQTDLQKGFRSLEMGNVPVIVHASLAAFGRVEWGADAVVKALLSVFNTVMVPTFTYKTMIIPLTGPEDNALLYGSGMNANRMSEFFTSSMPVDPLIGIVPETLRRSPQARRTRHPILSFAGVNADDILRTQTIMEPFAPINALESAGGWVLLLGVDHTVNTSIHYVEKLAGRRTFLRWALTPLGVRECPNFPGCSAGFNDIALDVEPFTRRARIGSALIQAVPLKELFEVVYKRIKQDPLALLCQQEGCERCQAILAQETREPSV